MFVSAATKGERVATLAILGRGDDGSIARAATSPVAAHQEN
jgi:hypothetical protein